MKRFLSLALATLLAAVVQAQHLTDNVAFSAGLGTLSNLFNQTLGSHGVSSESLLGPYHFKMEKRVMNHLSIGLSSSVMRSTTYSPMTRSLGGDISNMTNQVSNEAKRWSYGVAARANYHIGNSRRFDPYFGAGLGYRSHNWNGSNADYDGMNFHIANSPIAYEFGIGARYYILPGIGVYAEFGAGQSLLQTGFIIGMPDNRTQGGNGRTTGNKPQPPKPNPGGGQTTGGNSGGKGGKMGGK